MTKTHCSCGGKYKKTKPASGSRDGSRFFQCQQCWKVLERTAEGYEFEDQGQPPERIRREAAQREKQEREKEALIRSWGMRRF